MSISFLEQTNIVTGDGNSGPFFRILYPLVLMISDLQVATTKLRDVLGLLRKPTFDEFVLWLKFAEVYGAGYLDDVDYSKFNQRNTLTHRQ